MPRPSRTSLADMADSVMMDTPGVEWPAALRALKRGARNWYRDSLSWRERATPLVTSPGLAYYDILDIADVSVVAVRNVVVGTDDFDREAHRRYVKPEFMRMLHQTRPGNGAPEVAAWVDDHLWLWPAPATEGAVIGATLCLQPTLASDDIPTRLFDQHEEFIVKAARAILLRIPNQTFTDRQEAALLEDELRIKAGDEALRADNGNSLATSESRPYFI